MALHISQNLMHGSIAQFLKIRSAYSGQIIASALLDEQWQPETDGELSESGTSDTA